MDKVGIFYGPVGGSTERIAFKIANLLGKSNCDVLPVRDTTVSDLSKYKNVVFGIATIGNETWNSEPVKSGWFTFMGQMEKAKLTDKKIAIFGLGDHIRYADHFVDAMGELYNLLSEMGIDTVGKVDSSDYTFRESKSLKGDKFVGLPIDEEFEPALTDQRISEWVEELTRSFS